MSWYDSVVNAVKEVSKNVVEALASTSSHSHNNACGVVPFTNDRRVRIRNNSASSSDDDVRITTRARITYQLDRFKMNAMLLFVQTQDDAQRGRQQQYSIRDPNEIVETFINFRFEVDLNIDLTCAEIDTKCQEFFQQDFSEYGAVVVLVLSLEGGDGELTARDGLFSEFVILRHFTCDLNLSLLGKPKIYITETNRTGGEPQGVEHHYSLPILDQHQDILSFHIPAVLNSNGYDSTLSFLCNNINSLADSKDFVSILKKTVKDATDANEAFNDLPIELSNNFTKDMILARA